MQTIATNIENQDIIQKVLWFLNHLKDDGLYKKRFQILMMKMMKLMKCFMVKIYGYTYIFIGFIEA